jgi:succinoglycan biosynthesis protein ExoA
MSGVSVIIPCYNEEATIEQLLEAIYKQTYPLKQIEVVIADGLSTDRTREKIRQFQAAHPDLALKVVDNQRRVIPSGLNRAIEAAQGKFIIRMDAHSIPYDDYVERCIDGLEAGLGDNVGGIWHIQPGASTWIARAIALSVAHPLGAGDALYRIGGAAQEVETVPFGAFRRDIFNKIGLFDENLLSNEDYELNVRLKRSGRKIWLDPAIQSVYHARSTLRELSRQYWRYGYWKAQMLHKYPNTIRWRQGIPPLFISTLIGLAVLSLKFALARWLLAIIVILYTIIMLVVGLQMGRRYKDFSLAIGVPLATATIHVSWGLAFVWGLFAKPATHEMDK